MEKKYDPNAPAFGAGAQTLEDFRANLTPDDASVEEKPIIEEKEEEEIETSVEENKVPYSRFKNIHQRALDAEAEAERWRLKAEEIEQQRSRRFHEESDSEMPQEWKELYGDSEASEKAWKIQQRREELIEQRAYEAGQRGAQELKHLENARLNENLSTIDENFEDLAGYVGRNLTEKEQSAILDIVDDYTPKDSDGNYIGQTIPFEKAWEVYELKHSSGKTAQRQSRDSVASLSSTNTQGETDVKAEKDKNFNPLDWNAYKKFI